MPRQHTASGGKNEECLFSALRKDLRCVALDVEIPSKQVKLSQVKLVAVLSSEHRAAKMYNSTEA